MLSHIKGVAASDATSLSSLPDHGLMYVIVRPFGPREALAE
jgi:hypothetical protein